jgi:hypothetical protein
VLLAFLEFLVPGYAWILILGLSQRLNFFEKLCLSFLLSVCISGLLTAGFSLITSNYILYSIVVSLGFSFTILGVFYMRGSLLIKKPLPNIDRNFLPVLATIGIYVIILLLLNWSAPFYPTADANDPITHAQLAKAIITGDARIVLLQSGYPTGTHFASAILASLLSIDALQSLRILLSLVLLDVLFLAYFSANALLGSRRAASITVLVAAFVLPVDAIHFIWIGTFSNILEDAIILALLWLIFVYARQPSFALGATMSLLGFAALFIHSSFLLFLGALWISIPFLFIFSKSNLRNYLKAVTYLTIGFLLFSILAWPVFVKNLTAILRFATSPPPILLSLHHLTWNFTLFAGPINPIVILLAIVFAVKKQRNTMGLVFAGVWMIFLVASSFLSSIDWRFVLFSLLPGTFLIGSMIGSASSLLGAVLKNGSQYRKCARIVVPIILIVLTVSGGFSVILPRVYDPSSRARQQDIFDSMRWLKQNAGERAVASVGLRLDYRYLPVLMGIAYAGDFNESAQAILSLSLTGDFSYVVVATENPYFDSFMMNSVFHVEYRNEIAVVFSIGR